MQQETPDKSVLFIRSVPPELKQEFKAWCAKHGKTMRGAVVEFMKEKTEKENKHV